jgi:hypothetical protein
MTGEQIALWLGVVSVSLVILGAVLRAILALYRFIRGRVVKHREKVVRDAMAPLLATLESSIAEQLAMIRHNQAEMSEAVGRVYRLEEAVTNGLQADVAAVKRKQARMGERIDAIYDHLIN